MSDTPADPLQPPRVLPRAARLSRLAHDETATATVETSAFATPAVEPPAAEAPVAPQPPDSHEPVVASPPPSSDIVDLARAIAASAASDTVTTGAVTSDALRPAGSGTGASLRSVATTGSTAAPGQAAGPVTFRPLIDPWANRSVIVASFGLVLCFFPVLALAGLLMGLVSMRRIRSSDGMLTGERTARFGIMLGAAGVTLGAVFAVWFLATQ